MSAFDKRMRSVDAAVTQRTRALAHRMSTLRTPTPEKRCEGALSRTRSVWTSCWPCRRPPGSCWRDNWNYCWTAAGEAGDLGTRIGPSWVTFQGTDGRAEIVTWFSVTVLHAICGAGQSFLDLLEYQYSLSVAGNWVLMPASLCGNFKLINFNILWISAK